MGVSLVGFIICIIERRWRMVSFVVFSVIVFLREVQRRRLQISMSRSRICVICVVVFLSFIVWARSVIGFIRVVICFIPWWTSMIGVIRMATCLIPTSVVGVVVGVRTAPRSASSSSLSQVSHDVF